MSDQADSLRQLVRAQRLWREIAPREQPTRLSRTGFPVASMLKRGVENGRRLPKCGTGVGCLVVRAARWALGRADGNGE